MKISNPLEQFQVNSIFNLFYFDGGFLFDFSISNYSITVFILVFFLIMIINVFGFFYQINLFGQTLLINFINISIQMIKDHIGNTGKSLFPLLTAYLFVTFLSNLLGMVPYGITLTAQLVVTFYFRKSFLLCPSILVAEKYLAYLFFKLAFLLLWSGVLKRVATDGSLVG